MAGFGLATVVFGLSRDFTLSFVMLALTGALAPWDEAEAAPPGKIRAQLAAAAPSRYAVRAVTLEARGLCPACQAG